MLQRGFVKRTKTHFIFISLSQTVPFMIYCVKMVEPEGHSCIFKYASVKGKWLWLVNTILL